MDILQRIERAIDNGESTLVNVVAKVAPWLAPIPTAWLVHHKTIALLHFPVAVAWIAAIIIEVLGLASVSTALMLREYNATRRKIPKDWEPFDKIGRRKKYKKPVDPKAPFSLAVVLAGVYFASVICLTIVLELIPQTGTLALIIFPFLSLTGATILALRADHRRRLQAIAGMGTSAQVSAQVSAQESGIVQMRSGAQAGAQNAQTTHTLEQVNRTRQAQKERLLKALESAYQENPDLGATEAGRLLGIHRNTVYNYRRELIANGRINDNGTSMD